MNIAYNFSKNFEILLDIFAERICNKDGEGSAITKDEVFKMAGAIIAESREVAKNTVEEISVTQSDLKMLETNTKAEFKSVRAEIQEFQAEFAKVRNEMSEFREEVHQEMAEMKQELKQEIDEVRGDIKALESKIDIKLSKSHSSVLKWVVGTQAALFAVFIAILGVVISKL